MAAHVAQVLRGGWGGPKPGYTLSHQMAASNGSQIEHVPFSGLDDELTAFVEQVFAHVCGPPQKFLSSSCEFTAYLYT